MLNIEDLEEELANLLGDDFKIKIVKGEVVIYTGLKKDKTGELSSLVESEDLEEEESEEDLYEEQSEDEDVDEEE